MSVILGLNALHAGASATLVIDGKPVVAIAEERLNRVKYYAGFPTQAVVRCLEVAGIKMAEVDAVAFGRNAQANSSRKFAFALRHPTRLPNLLKRLSRRSRLRDLQGLVAEHLGVNPKELRFREYHIEHHLAHIASAYYASGWDRAAGISIDGAGDFVTCMMSECVGNEIRVRRRIFLPHSLGTLYTMVCQFIGYGRYGDEGKVMGLAPLGEDSYREHLDRMLLLRDGTLSLNQDFFVPLGANQGLSINDQGEMVLDRYYSDLMVQLFGEPRPRHGEILKRDKDLAFGLQSAFEEGYLHLLRSLHDLVPLDDVVIAGGCALNSVANGKIFRETPFLRTWIQPAAGDEGLSLGAALYVSRAILKEGEPSEMVDSYLGPEYSEEEIRRELDRLDVRYVRLDRGPLLEETAEEIRKGKVVGWFQARMEWGPRALGNRSILAHPGLEGMKDVLNARVKHREPFRPFAPSVLAERQAAIFTESHPSPFMLHVYEIRPEWRERLSAITHVDGTGRLQSVTREENPLYYDLIETFERKTGIPVVLNTSFNENEPIVCAPEEAIACYLRTKMDMLVIGPFVCRKDGSDGA